MKGRLSATLHLDEGTVTSLRTRTRPRDPHQRLTAAMLSITNAAIQTQGKRTMKPLVDLPCASSVSRLAPLWQSIPRAREEFSQKTGPAEQWPVQQQSTTLSRSRKRHLERKDKRMKSKYGNSHSVVRTTVDGLSRTFRGFLKACVSLALECVTLRSAARGGRR